MRQVPSHTSLTDLVRIGVPSDYVASAAHYQAIAKRIITALRGGFFVLVTGDPPVDPNALAAALDHVASPGSSVIIISCGREFTGKGLKSTVPILAEPKAASFILILDDFGRLSDRQIEDLWKRTLRLERIQQPSILLAQVDFVSRLEQPALFFLRDRIGAQFHFQEIGDDETVAALHTRLASLGKRRVEEPRFRRGVLVGLAAGAAVLTTAISAFTMFPAFDPAGGPPAVAGRVSSASQGSVPKSVNEMTISGDLSGEPKQVAASPSPASKLVGAPPSTPLTQLTSIAHQPPKIWPMRPKPAAPSRIAAAAPAFSKPAIAPLLSANVAPAMAEFAVAPGRPLDIASAASEPADGHRLSAATISALLAHGDAFLAAGDIASARLCYERAADADNASAALRVGATFDTIFARRAVLGAFTADPEKALFWYRRAWELGSTEAARRIKALETPPAIEADRRPSSSPTSTAPRKK